MTPPRRTENSIKKTAPRLLWKNKREAVSADEINRGILQGFHALFPSSLFLHAPPRVMGVRKGEEGGGACVNPLPPCK